MRTLTYCPMALRRLLYLVSTAGREAEGQPSAAAGPVVVLAVRPSQDETLAEPGAPVAAAWHCPAGTSRFARTSQLRTMLASTATSSGSTVTYVGLTPFFTPSVLGFLGGSSAWAAALSWAALKGSPSGLLRV